MSNTQTATVTTTNTAVITGKTAPRIYFPAIIFGTLGALIGLFTAGAGKGFFFLLSSSISIFFYQN